MLCLQTDWNRIFTTEDSLEHFHLLLSNKFNISFPVVKIKHKRHCPWYTKGLKTSAANLRSLQYIKKFLYENDFFVNYYKNYRTTYRKLVKVAKRSYYRNKIEQSSNINKESWKIVNKLRGKDSSVVSSTLKANDLNSFYCSIASDLSKKIISNKDPLDYLSNISVSDTFFLYQTTSAEIKKIFKKLKNKSASGWDKISLKVFEALPEPVLDALAGAINISFETGKFPDCLKRALIIPLFKGGDHKLPSNFRALLPTSSKIIEKLVQIRLISFLTKHKLLSAT